MNRSLLFTEDRFRTSSLLIVVPQIAKVDVVTREHIVWTQDNCFPSEPVFVASPGAVEEDDGEFHYMFQRTAPTLREETTSILRLSFCLQE